MDYKTNQLTATVTADQNLLPEIPGLHFCILANDKALFDYDAYFAENNIPPIDHKVFMRMNKRFIESLSQQAGEQTSELFFLNKDGHILVSAQLAFLFLAFVNPELCAYFNSLLADVITDGIAFSNGFIYALAQQRIPADMLENMANNIQNDSE